MLKYLLCLIPSLLIAGIHNPGGTSTGTGSPDAGTPIYGQLYIDDDYLPETIADTVTWHQVTNWTVSSYEGVTLTTSNATIAADGPYVGMTSFSPKRTTGSQDQEIEIAVFINDVEAPEFTGHRTFTTDAVGMGSLSGIGVPLQIGDVLDLRFRGVNTTAPNAAVGLLHGNFSLFRLTSSGNSTNWSQYAAATDVNIGGNSLTNALEVAATTGTFDYVTGDGSGVSNVTANMRWDYIYAESVGLCVGPAQPSSYITNIVYSSGVTQQVEFLAFDDADDEFSGKQKWQTSTNWDGTITVTVTAWYEDQATQDVAWGLHYVADGTNSYEATFGVGNVGTSSPTNLHQITASATLSQATAGDAVTYWIGSDSSNDKSGDSYLDTAAIGWGQE